MLGEDAMLKFASSADGKTFVPLGKTYQLTWGSYRGDRVGVYTLNDGGEAGFVDVDAFEYRIAASDGKR